MILISVVGQARGHGAMAMVVVVLAVVMVHGPARFVV